MAKMSHPTEHPLLVTNTTSIEVVEATEPWSTYRLADGTTIRAKLRVHSFFRWNGHYDLEGRPVYSNQTLVDFVVEAPDELMEGHDPA